MMLGALLLAGAFAYGGPGFIGRVSVNAPASFAVNYGAGSGHTLLAPTLVVNGTTTTLMFDCRGEGAATTNLVCNTGGTLAQTGAGTAPTINQPSPFTESADRSILFVASGKEYDGDASTGDVTTQDLFIEGEVFTAYDGAGEDYIVAKKDDGGTGNGWSISMTSTTNLRLTIDAGATSAAINTSVGAGTWTYFFCFVNRDEASTNGSQCFSKSAGTGVDSSGAAGSLTTTDVFRLGGLVAAGSTYTGRISFARGYTCPACVLAGAPGAAEMLATYSTRRSALGGSNPTTNAGVATISQMPFGAPHFVDIVDAGLLTRRRFYADATMAPIVRRVTTSGSAFVGFFDENNSVNLLLRSEDFAAASWTKSQVGDTMTNNVLTAPDLRVVMASYDAAVDAIGLEHCATQAPTLAASTETISFDVVAGQQTKAFIRDATIANGVAWFDLTACASCAVGKANCSGAFLTKQAGITKQHAHRYPIDTDNDGDIDVEVCRVGVTFTGTAAAHTLSVCGASADGVLTYTEGADATVDWYVGQALRDHFGAIIGSPVITAGASVTRNGLSFRYAPTANVNTAASATAEIVFMFPDGRPTGDAGLVAVYGTAGTDDLIFAVSSAGTARTVGHASSSTQWDISGTTDLADGNSHTMRVVMAPNAISLYVDGIQEGVDTSATLPTPANLVTTLRVGEESSGLRADSVIKSVTFYPYASVP